MTGDMMERHPALRVEKGTARRMCDDIIREESYTIYLNNEMISEQVASPDQLRELGVGFVICEGFSRSVLGVEVDGDGIWVEADSPSPQRMRLLSSGGMGGGRGTVHPVISSHTLSADDIYVATEEIVSDIWKKTGGVHCSVLVSEGEVVAKSSDIGRHNTVDKVVGAAELAGIDRSRCVLGCTGRQPSAMVRKSANGGIPVVISRAASTDRGILTADAAGITLICFSRGERFTVYTHPERIAGILRKHDLKEKNSL